MNGEISCDVKVSRGKVFRVTVPLNGPVELEVPNTGCASALRYIRALGSVVWALASCMIADGNGGKK